MKEVPCRRKNLHSIISKISGSVEASPSEEECTADNKNIIQNDKANSELSIADDQHKPMKNMLAEETNKIPNNISRTNSTKDGTTQQENPMVDRLSVPYNCKPCNVGFLTQRELQLHAMCHGICISGDVKELDLKNTAIDVSDKSETSDGRGEDNKIHDKDIDCRKSPMIQKQTLLTNKVARSDEDHERLSPTYEFNGATTDNPAASSIPGEPTASQDSTVNNELGHGKIVDVLSLATATRGFKEPGSIWCSLCKCSVDKGHICKINQPSYHAEKKEEGFTCELCGRYYNQKRKLRTHLRNRHKGFRLQEDEGYMCWQCWQAFPEIKILEQHIVTVHGHESRRQNSTWRPFSSPSTLPSLGETIDNQSTEDAATQNIAAPSGKNQDTTSLKRPGDDITNECPAKRTPEGIVCNKVLNVGEVNGKVVVNDSFLLTTEGPACPQPTMELPPDTAVQMNLSIPCGADKNSGEHTGATHDENTSKSLPFDQPNYLTNQTSNPSLNITVNNPTTNHLVNPSVIYSSNGNKRKSVAGPKAQQCPHCPEVFPKKYILQLHIQQNHSDYMHCFFCSTSCSTKEALSIHIKDVHSDEVKNGKCPICQCKCLGELHQHIVQYHYKDLLTRKDKDRVLPTCPICHQTTTDAYHLRWHVLNEHGGMVLPGEQQEGSLEETSSESGSSVSSEGRLGNVVPERTTGITKGTTATSDGTTATSDGIMVTSDGNVAEVVKENARCEETDTDEIEIVFVSDKKPDSGWSKQQGTISNHPRSDSPIKVLKEFPNVSGSPVQTIKKPADSSGNVGDGPKFNEKCVTADNVDSTTGQEEPKSQEVSLQRQASGMEQTPCNYQKVSEQACIFCFNNFTDKKTLVTHLKTAHGWLDTFTCPICYYEGQNYLNVVEHFCKSHFHPIDDTLSQSEVKCLKCDIIFQDIAHLKKHSTALHSFQIPSVPRYNTFKCRHCNIVFDKKFDAQKHFDAYHLFRIRYKCETCRMGFTAKYDFQEHVTCNHPELVNSFCPVCGLGFEVNADLEEHVFEMHRRKAQFFCAKCRNEFGDRFHVHMHIRSNCCVQWADSNFECLDCLTAFSSISELRIHCNQKNCKPSGK